MKRVQEEPVFSTARPFRTGGGPLRYRMCRMQRMPGKRSLFPDSATGNLTNTRKRGLFPRRHHRQTPYKRQKETSSYSTTAKTLTANPTNTRDKRPLPRTAPPQPTNVRKRAPRIALPRRRLRQIPRKRQKEAFSRTAPPANAHRQIPRSRILWQQGIIYSGGGARAHGFNYFLTLFL